MIKGEIFKIEKSQKKSTQSTDSQINEKYSRGEIRIITEQARYPLDTITSMLSSGKYNLNPEYQRRKRWGLEQQSKLIESFIINVPIPPIFIYEVSFAQYEIMDGLQRLTAIDNFYKDKFALVGLEEWSELNGRKYSNLPKSIKEGIDRRYLSSIVLLNETAKDEKTADALKQMVFGRLNSGGDKLTPQESRNALYMGKFNDMCIKLSQNEYFRKLWNYPQYEWNNGHLENEFELTSNDSFRTMEDVEMVLRFFAYRHYEQLSNFKTQELFLDEFLRQANNFSDQTINELETLFQKTTKLTFELFGQSAFYMPETGSQKRNTPTKTIYDPLLQVIARHLDSEKILLEKKEIINSFIYKNAGDLEYVSKTKKVALFDGKYNSKNNVDARVKYFDKIINEVL